MKTNSIYLTIICLFISAGLFAQTQKQKNVLAKIKSKTYYFQHLAGEIEVDTEGRLHLNGVKMDLNKIEIGHQTSENGDNIIYFITSNNEDELEAWNNGKLLFKTNNVIHLIKSKEQAIELVVLFNKLKTCYAS